MSNYTKSTNFATKDALPSGDPLKIVKGTEIDTEFNNIATAIATKVEPSSPNFTGTPTAPTATAGTSTTQIATTDFVTAADVVVIAATAAAYPTKSGTGATGTWGINVTGNAATATSATSATSATNAGTVTTITTSQTLAAVAGSTFGAVGTYAYLSMSTSTGLLGGIVAGSSLNKFVSGAAVSAGVSGGWMNMGPFENSSSGSCLFLRVY